MWLISFPSAGSAAGKHKAGVSDRKADLLGIHMPPEASQFRSQHVGQHRRSQAGGVRVDQEEQGMIGQKLSAQFHQGVNGVLDLPDLALGSPPVGGRIHDDGVIVIAPPDLPFYEFDTVIHQPAEAAFSFAQVTIPLEASTWVTLAPAAAAARVAPPV